jgi:hypothetical protein
MTEPGRHEQELGRVIATIDGKNGYKALIVSFRERIMELGTHMEAVDAVAGLPTRYTGKLLDIKIKKVGQRSYNLGMDSLGPLLGALGLKLVVMVDETADYKIKEGLNGLKRRGMSGSKLNNTGFRTGFENPRIARLARAKQLTISPSKYRSMSARIAVCARWQKYRERKAAEAARLAAETAHQARLARRRALRQELRMRRKLKMEAAHDTR